MATYDTDLAKLYIKHYGKHLDSHYDRAEKTVCKERIFCLDCLDFEACKGRFWKGCPNRAKVLKIIKGES